MTADRKPQETTLKRREWWISDDGDDGRMQLYAYRVENPYVDSCVHVIEATPATLAADELREMLVRITCAEAIGVEWSMAEARALLERTGVSNASGK